MTDVGFAPLAFDLAGAFTDPVDAGVVVASPADLLRLVAVPAFGWAAWRDVKTRRIPSRAWIPMVVLAVSLLSLETVAALGSYSWGQFALQAGLAVGFVVPLGYLFWRIGGFGGADVKAVMVLALLFPTFPTYLLKAPLTSVLPGALPVFDPPVGVFSFTVLTNAVLVGVVYPVAATVRNAVAGRFSPVMFVGRPVDVEALPETYGRLLERPEGKTRRGLDLDAMRMYLRWRGLSLSELRADPDRYRDPASLPESPNEPTDGNVMTDGGQPGDAEADGTDAESGGSTADAGPDGGGSPDAGDADRVETDEAAGPTATETGEDADSEAAAPDYDDPWGAEAFLSDIEGSAYGTRADDLRDGLEVVARQDTVWVSPGLPFIVPLFLGLLAAITYGDVLFGVLAAAGVI